MTGVELCVRKKGDRIEVWVEDIRDMSGMMKFSRVVRKKLCVGSSEKIQFTIHKKERVFWGQF